MVDFLNNEGKGAYFIMLKTFRRGISQVITVLLLVCVAAGITLTFKAYHITWTEVALNDANSSLTGMNDN